MENLLWSLGWIEKRLGRLAWFWASFSVTRLVMGFYAGCLRKHNPIV